jgi:hypothetical protein
MRPTPRIIGLVTVTLLALSACGDTERLSSDEPVVTNPATPTTPDPDSPVTSPVDDPTTTLPGAFDADEAARRAASLLGAQEGDLPDDVRVARRGDEEFPLTADLVPGRLTVQLDDDGTGTFVVVEVQIESEDGVQVVSVDSLLDNAASFLGTPEPGLDPSWRVGRRGDETFALTEDFIVGRFTVELDDDGTGAFVVTAVIVELPGGAQVGEGGLEPPHVMRRCLRPARQYWHLKPARLPFRHSPEWKPHASNSPPTAQPAIRVCALWS